MTTGASAASSFDHRERSCQRAAAGKPSRRQVQHDGTLGKRSRDRSVRIDEVEPQRRDAPVRASERDQIEQLHDLMAHGAVRLAIAQVRVRFGDHDAIEEETSRQPREPAALVRIADAQRRARSADDLQVDETRRERDRDVVTAQRRAERAGRCAARQHDDLVDVVVAFHDDAVVFARNDGEVRVGKRGSDRCDRRRREHEVADAIGAREQNLHARRSARSNSSKYASFASARAARSSRRVSARSPRRLREPARANARASSAPRSNACKAALHRIDAGRKMRAPVRMQPRRGAPRCALCARACAEHLLDASARGRGLK